MRFIIFFGLFGLDGFLAAFRPGDDVPMLGIRPAKCVSGQRFPAYHLFAERRIDGFAVTPHGQGDRRPSPSWGSRRRKCNAVVSLAVCTAFDGQAVDNQQGFHAGWRHRVPLRLFASALRRSQAGPRYKHIEYSAMDACGFPAVRDLDGFFSPLSRQGRRDLHCRG